MWQQPRPEFCDLSFLGLWPCHLQGTCMVLTYVQIMLEVCGLIVKWLASRAALGHASARVGATNRGTRAITSYLHDELLVARLVAFHFLFLHTQQRQDVRSTSLSVNWTQSSMACA
jgi:hypothetical protein